MDDALVVGGRERLGELPRERERLRHRKRTGGEAVGQRPAFDELEDQRRDIFGIRDTIDGRDVRMIERREGARLALEARAPSRVGSEVRRQDLERDVAAEPRVVGAIDGAHASSPIRATTWKVPICRPMRDGAALVAGASTRPAAT